MMSVSDKLIRLMPEPNQAGMRREILAALVQRGALDSSELAEAVKHNPRGEFVGGFGLMVSVLDELAGQGVVEIAALGYGAGDDNSPAMVRLTHYGRDELEQMGAANV